WLHRLAPPSSDALLLPQGCHDATAEGQLNFGSECQGVLAAQVAVPRISVRVVGGVIFEIDLSMNRVLTSSLCPSLPPGAVALSPWTDLALTGRRSSRLPGPM